MAGISPGGFTGVGSDARAVSVMCKEMKTIVEIDINAIAAIDLTANLRPSALRISIMSGTYGFASFDPLRRIDALKLTSIVNPLIIWPVGRTFARMTPRRKISGFDNIS